MGEAMWALVVGLVPRAPWVRPDPLCTPAAPPGRWPSGLAAVVALVCAMAATAVTGGAALPDERPAVDAAATTDACAPGWVTGWQAATQPAPADPVLAGSTLRMVVYPQVTGSEVRVRVSNAYGSDPLVLGTVSAAWSDGAAGLVPATMQPVAFGGRSGILVPAGVVAVSDPVPLVAEVGRPLAVSLFVAAAPATVTHHAVALQTSYLAAGADVALTADGTAFGTAVGSWQVLTGVEVLAPRPVNAVVAVGDSLTDGVGSGPGTNQRWPDALAERLTRAGGPLAMAVLNAGISRNRLLADGASDGDSPLTRFDRDVEAAAGATDVVLHIGTNDIAAGAGPEEIVAGLRQFVRRGHAAGKRVFLTTVTPSGTGAHGTPAATATRAAVNAWVRTHGPEHADGVFDFAAAVADPARPSRLAPAFDSGDGLHLSPAGYRALAGAVDTHRLTGSPCLSDRTPVRVAVAGSPS